MRQVWEVAAQLAGLAASVALLRAIEATGRPENVVAVWAAVQAMHTPKHTQLLPVPIVTSCVSARLETR